jgi:hypothetical protein
VFLTSEEGIAYGKARNVAVGWMNIAQECLRLGLDQNLNIQLSILTAREELHK